MNSKRNQTLEQWCIENNNEDILKRWDYEKNPTPPSKIINFHNIAPYFKCENNIHDSEVKTLGNVIKYNKVPGCKICSSFGIWCEKHNRFDLLKRWDYEKNILTPYDISVSTTKKYYFKCPKGIHESELKDINNIRKQFHSGRCVSCASIGQFGIDYIDKDFINKYWSDKNIKNPMVVNRNSNSKIWIKCQDVDYHEDYEVTCSNFITGKRCPYCAKKKIHPKESLGGLYPQCYEYWVQKKTTPLDYLPMSNKLVYWKCDKHGEYRRKICDMVNADFVCPKCRREEKESKLQKKVHEYLSSLGYTIKTEYDCSLIPINPNTNYPLPFDNEVVELKLIIEVNGEQHYKKSYYNNYSEEELLKRQQIDKFKQEYAINHGYSFLIVPYWTNNKKESWKTIIDKKIESIV